MLRLLGRLMVALGLLSAAWCFQFAQPAYAYDPLDTACTGVTSPTCDARTTDNPLTGPRGFLMKVTYVVAVIAGFSAIIVIIVSGARYMTAGGDAKQAVEARNGLVGALIGLFIISLASIIITFVITKLG